MPLDDIFMLPKRVRTMEQMADLLQAEKRMFDMLLQVLEEMSSQAEINNNTPLTKEKLEQIASMFAGNPCRVDEFSERLTIHIVVSRNSGKPTSPKTIIDGVDVLIPAHLKYCVVFELVVPLGVCIMRRAYKFPLDLCGRGYAGEQPFRNMVGAIRADGVEIELAGRSAVFRSPLAGTAPQRNLAGLWLVQENGPQVTAQARRYTLDMGRTATGEQPCRNVEGSQEAGMIPPEVTATAYIYSFDYCGTDYCGEEGG